MGEVTAVGDPKPGVAVLGMAVGVPGPGVGVREPTVGGTVGGGRGAYDPLPAGSSGEAEAAPLMIAIAAISTSERRIAENANRCLLWIVELLNRGYNVLPFFIWPLD